MVSFINAYTSKAEMMNLVTCQLFVLPKWWHCHKVCGQCALRDEAISPLNVMARHHCNQLYWLYVFDYQSFKCYQ